MNLNDYNPSPRLVALIEALNVARDNNRAAYALAGNSPAVRLACATTRRLLKEASFDVARQLYTEAGYSAREVDEAAKNAYDAPG